MEIVVRDVVHFCDMMSDKYSGVKCFFRIYTRTIRKLVLDINNNDDNLH